jgi:hypothetical protein
MIDVNQIKRMSKRGIEQSGTLVQRPVNTVTTPLATGQSSNAALQRPLVKKPEISQSSIQTPGEKKEQIVQEDKSVKAVEQSVQDIKKSGEENDTKKVVEPGKEKE